MNVKKLDYGFEVTDSSHEWSLTVLNSPGQDGTTPLLVVYCEIDGGLKFYKPEDSVLFSRVEDELLLAVRHLTDKWKSGERRGVLELYVLKAFQERERN